jgi:iron complex transport system permease protein
LDKKNKIRFAGEVKISGDEKTKKSSPRSKSDIKNIDPRSKTIIAFLILFPIIYFLAIIQPSMMWVYEYDMSPAKYFSQMGLVAMAFFRTLGGESNFVVVYVATQFIIIALVGASLSTAGCVFQGAFRNGLASPTTLGVSSGGTALGTVFVLLFYGTSIYNDFTLTLSIFLGSIIMVFIIVFLAKTTGGGKISNITIIVSGMIFAGGFSEIVNLVQYYNLSMNTFSDKATILRYMMVGTLDNIMGAKFLILPGLPLLIVLLIVLCFRSKLNLIALGDEEAKALGVDVSGTKNILIALVTLMNALIISFCGMIGFVGFIVPHLARRLVGPDFKWLLPCSMLIGADFMMVVFSVARITGIASNINTMTSLLGGIFFLLFVVYHGRRRGRKGGVF